MIISLSCGNIIAGFIFLIFCHLLYLVAFSSIVWLKLLLGHAPSYMPFIRTPYIPVRRGLRSATRGSLVKSSARRETLDGRSIHINSLYMPADLEETPPPSVTNTDPAGFHSALKTFLFRESYPLH